MPMKRWRAGWVFPSLHPKQEGHDPRPDELTQDQQGDESPFLNQLEKQKFRGHDDDHKPGEKKWLHEHLFFKHPMNVF